MARIFKAKSPKRRAVRGPDGKPVMVEKIAKRGPNKGKAIKTPKLETVRDRKGNIVYVESRKWTIEYRDADDAVVTVPGFADRKATLQRAAELERLAEHEQSGLVDVYAEHRKRPLSEHLEDWRNDLATRNTQAHADSRYARVKRIIDGCGFKVWPDVSASRVEAFIKTLRQPETPKADAKAKGQRRAITIKTANYYRDAVKSFAKWMVQDRRAPANPLEHLKNMNPKKDRRRERRALTEDEAKRLIETTHAGPERFGMSGERRSIMYRLILETGLRQNEVRTLVPEAFDLEANPPMVRVRAAYAKGGRDDDLPLRPTTAADLAEHVEQAERGQAVFPLPLDRRHVIGMLRADLEAAGIAYVDEDGRYADFHALRHSFITGLAKAGVAPKVAMDLARHVDVNLTLRHYSHTIVEDRAQAIAHLPDLAPKTTTEAEQARATGTDDQTADQTIPSTIRNEGVSRPIRLASDCTEGEAEGTQRGSRDPHKRGPIGASRRSVSSHCASRDSNPNPLGDRNLNPARLPVPPLALWWLCRWGAPDWGGHHPAFAGGIQGQSPCTNRTGTGQS